MSGIEYYKRMIGDEVFYINSKFKAEAKELIRLERFAKLRFLADYIIDIRKQEFVKCRVELTQLLEQNLTLTKERKVGDIVYVSYPNEIGREDFKPNKIYKAKITGIREDIGLTGCEIESLNMTIILERCAHLEYDSWTIHEVEE